MCVEIKPPDSSPKGRHTTADRKPHESFCITSSTSNDKHRDSTPITENTASFSTMSEKMTDLEKADASTHRSPSTAELGITEPVNALQRFCNKLDAVCGVETRGIERIPEEIRERDMSLKDYIHMYTM